MTAPLPAGLALVASAVLAVAGYAGGWMIAGAAGLTVLALSVGWGDLLGLPDRAGTSVLVLLLGAGGLVTVTVAVSPEVDVEQPLSVVGAVMAVAVLTTFAHELVRRDGRHELVESVTGTLAGQFVAVLAAGWVLVGHTAEGASAVVVTAVATAVARIVLTLPVPPPVLTWVAVGAGLVSAVVAGVVAGDISAVTAGAVGISVSGVGIAVDRLVVPQPTADGPAARLVLGTLARAAAPVAAAGTAAYAVFRIGIG